MVQHIHDLLEAADASGRRFYSITDKDTRYKDEMATYRYAWDVYHIENYLLESEFIFRVVHDISGGKPGFPDARAVYEEVRECARESLPSLIRERLEHEAYTNLTKCVRTRGDRSKDTANALREAIDASVARLNDEIERQWCTKKIGGTVRRLEKDLERSLNGDGWRKKFRGRDVLKKFAKRHVKGVNYTGFRNLIVANMKERGYQPKDMKDVITKNLNA